MNRKHLALAAPLLFGALCLVRQIEAGTLLTAPTIAGIVTGVTAGIVALLLGRRREARTQPVARATEGA
ncbi:hypothetical protein ATL41_2526 [Flavimobilis soli]|uniref:Uncharacterized protein n=1 Tax=Flavimobilis soli TaxID=442709 RepID=A0A2A9EFZ8_9MICO|nr:hypothetical protein [Flavimobilis soli]PFG37753.1 hypothetical protein ATL41_2526 [Flavimobilis soli]